MAFACVGLGGCPPAETPQGANSSLSNSSPDLPSAPPTAGSFHARADSRFIRIRDLLREDPDTQARAVKLYALVEPVCTDAAARTDFLETMAWSASFSDKKYRMTVVYALDTLEHVATSCARNYLDGSLALLQEAARTLPDEPRVFVIQARLLAAHGRFREAEGAARRAKELGHVHALALTAHIQARIAREVGVGYRPGMLDAAIETVMAEPTADWALIDLEAVLVTRARLLLERAVWELPERAKVSTAQAQTALRRLSVAPFEKNARRRALDALCFFAIQRGSDPDGACRRAAEKMHNLGAARAVGLTLDPEAFEARRLQGLESIRETLGTLGRADTALVIFRGDEAEILEWVRPAVRLLARLAQSYARTVFIDRTSSPRAAALAKRVVTLAGLEPVLRLSVGRDTLAMPCIAAVVAQRRTPQGCPVAPTSLDRLGRLHPPRLSFLIGRDLDAEIDDLRLYALPAVLLSFRQSRHEKTLAGWLKSQSDAFLVVPPSVGGPSWVGVPSP